MVRLLGWIRLFVYAKYKAVKDTVFQTMTPQRWKAHGFVLLTSILICAAVFFGIIPESTQNKLGYFQRETLLFYFRMFGWVMNVFEKRRRNFLLGGFVYQWRNRKTFCVKGR